MPYSALEWQHEDWISRAAERGALSPEVYEEAKRRLAKAGMAPTRVAA